MEGVVEIPVELKPRGNQLEDKAKKAAETFTQRIQSGVERTVKMLGLDKFTSVAIGNKEEDTSSKTAIAQGMAAGLVAGGVVGLLGLIANAIADFPIVTAIM